jgi:hypothetical protein
MLKEIGGVSHFLKSKLAKLYCNQNTYKMEKMKEDEIANEMMEFFTPNYMLKL